MGALSFFYVISHHVDSITTHQHDTLSPSLVTFALRLLSDRPYQVSHVWMTSLFRKSPNPYGMELTSSDL